tara:strand:+ start:298 stop:549 length:252 start_codon:yes stop_codon:yes gene_type:complete
MVIYSHLILTDYGGKTVREKDKLREYRGLIRRDIDELEKRLDVIEEKIDKLNTILGKHIDFIDNTYEGLKNPIKFATKMLGGR